MTTSEAIKKVLDIARAEIGYQEKASNSQLDDKTANAGSGNWTKYARDLDAVTNFYNGAKNGFAYCDIFHDWLHYKAWGAALAMQVLCQPERSAGAGCAYSAQYYQNAGRWHTSNPQAGDQIFFYSGGGINHTGIVESVSGSTVTTIEGNTSDMVARRTYTIGSSYIAGYGRPKYELVANVQNETPQVTASAVAPATTNSMKYSASNPPMVCMMTQSTCYRGTSTMAIKGVLWHSTGANNPWLKRYVQPDDNAPNRAELLAKLGTNPNRNDWNHIEVQAGLNAWIGKLDNGTVTTVQTMPWNYKPWGCGSGSRGSCNNGWIQFEICEDALSDASYFNAVYKEACEFTAFICKTYGINPLGSVSVGGVSVPTILCHQDSYKYGLGSNHGDVYHWFNRYGKTMDDVRSDVSKLLGGGSVSTGGTTVAPTTSGRAVLRKGDYNDDVRELQEKLEYLGYDVGGVDGDFGKNTLAAVTEFQSKNGLEVDGVVGQQTWDALDKAVATKKAAGTTQVPSTPTSTGTVKVGDTVSITAGATYYNGKAIPAWVTSQKWVVASVAGDRAIVNVSADGKYRINSPINVKFLSVASASPSTTPSQQTQAPTTVAVGDIVNFIGSTHYISSGAKAGGACKPGKAKVTQIYGFGSAAHPYHLVAVAGGGATVHGWVDADTVQKA
ncbi:MAG: peptidoglycan-binding protein [Prevotella sp.]|nr:peptidoglycan-binding protein [Prevotella sp.]